MLGRKERVSFPGKRYELMNCSSVWELEHVCLSGHGVKLAGLRCFVLKHLKASFPLTSSVSGFGQFSWTITCCQSAGVLPPSQGPPSSRMVSL